MHGIWRVGSAREAIWIVRRNSGAAPDGATRLEPSGAARRVFEWFPDTPRSRALLTEICAAVEGTAGHDALTPTAALRTRVGTALREGWIEAWLIRIPIPLGAKKDTPVPPPAPAPPPPGPNTTWVEIQLFDDDSPPKPVPLKKFKITLPDGSTREGVLDDAGKVAFEGIDPGTCKVSFPELNGPDWKAS
jgi:hypothetical protein